MPGHYAARSIPGVEAVDDATYRRTIVVNRDPGVLEISASDTDGELLLRAHLPHWEGLIHLVEQARRIIALDADVRAAADKLRQDPLIGWPVAASPGRRVPGCWDPFEPDAFPATDLGLVRSLVALHPSSGPIAQAAKAWRP